MLSLRGHADARVVRRVLKGERDEFGVLVNRYLPVVHAVAYAHTGNRADAEDAVQDGFLSAFEKLATLREAHKFGSWLIAIVRNACRERHKTDVKRNALMEKADLPAAVASPDMVRRELHDMLHQQMDQLDAAHREVLLMHYFAGMRVGEIAALLGASPAAVRKRLQRARDVLSKQMLRQMRPDLEPETRRDRTRAARIMGIIAAAPAPWQAAVTPGATSAAVSAVTTLGGVLIVKKAIIAIVVVLAGILGVWTLTREDPAKRTQEEWPAATEAAPTEVGVSAPEPVQAAPPEPPPGVPPAENSTPEQPVAAEMPAAPQGDEQPASISGIVMNDQGYPIVNAQILVITAGMWDEDFLDKSNHYWAKSDADGKYEVTGIVFSGAVQIDAFAEGYTVAPNAPSEVSLKPGVSVSNVDITMRPGVMLRGRVLDTLSAPIDGAVVHLLGFDHAGGARFGTSVIACTDENGLFQLGFEAAGVAAFSVLSPTGASGVFTDVPVGENGVVDLRLQKPAGLKGMIVWSDGTPAAGLCLRLLGEVSLGKYANSYQDARWRQAVTDAKGEYEFGQLSPGIRYSGDVHVFAPGENITGRTEVKGNVAVDELMPGEVRTLDLVVPRLEARMVVKGHVCGAQTGRPIWPARVFPMRNGEIVQHTGQVVAMDGSFELTVMAPPGEYVIYADYYDHSFPEMCRPYGKKVYLREGETVELDLTIPEPVGASLRVVDRLGKPIQGAKILVLQDSEGSVGGSTNADGRYPYPSITPWTEFWFRISKGGYATKETEHHPSEEPGTACPEETIVLFESGRIQGTAVDASRNILADRMMLARARYEDGEVALEGVRTDAQGIFVIMDVPATEVTLELSISTQGTADQPPSYTGRAILESLECLPGQIIDAGEVVFAPPR